MRARMREKKKQALVGGGQRRTKATSHSLGCVGDVDEKSRANSSTLYTKIAKPAALVDPLRSLCCACLPIRPEHPTTNWTR